MKSCIACGMPLENQNDIGCEIADGAVCVYCSTPDKNVKSCDEVFEGGVQFFMGSTGADRAFAEKLVRKNMNKLPYWQNHKAPCLNGEEATDEEFAKVLGGL